MSDTSALLSFLIARVEWSPLHLLVLFAAVQRIVELRLAKRNERALRERGAVETGGNHYPAIVALHALWFVGMIVEIIFLSRAVNPFWPALLIIFLLAQGLRYWAIRSLGDRWNTKILVVPGSRPINSGPYRFLKHPNYIAVVAELFTLPVMLGAYLTAVTASLLNLVLLRIRIKAEEEAVWGEVKSVKGKV